MEPEIRAFFALIINCISRILLWMLIQVTAGLYFGLAYFDRGIRWPGIVYYLFLVISFIVLVKYLLRNWRRYKEFTEYHS